MPYLLLLLLHQAAAHDLLICRLELNLHLLLLPYAVRQKLVGYGVVDCAGLVVEVLLMGTMVLEHVRVIRLFLWNLLQHRVQICKILQMVHQVLVLKNLQVLFIVL
jgi:hypothetical protein